MGIDTKYIVNNAFAWATGWKPFADTPSYFDPPPTLPTGSYYEVASAATGATAIQPRLSGALPIARPSPILLNALAGLDLRSLALYSLDSHTYVGGHNAEGQWGTLSVGDLPLIDGQLVSPQRPRAVIALLEGKEWSQLPRGTVAIGTNGHDYVLDRTLGLNTFTASRPKTPWTGTYYGLPLEIISAALATTHIPGFKPYRE